VSEPASSSDRPAATCSSCGAPIVWGRTATGKPMPLDAEPVDMRGLLMRDRFSGSVITLELAYPVHRTHFATCPNAASHRKRSRA